MAEKQKAELEKDLEEAENSLADAQRRKDELQKQTGQTFPPGLPGLVVTIQMRAEAWGRAYQALEEWKKRNQEGA